MHPSISPNIYAAQWTQNVTTGNKKANLAIAETLISENRKGNLSHENLTDFLFAMHVQDDPAMMPSLKKKHLSKGFNETNGEQVVVSLGTALCEHCLQKYQEEYDANLRSGNVEANKAILHKLIDHNLGIPAAQVAKFMSDNKVDPNTIGELKKEKFTELKKYIQECYPDDPGIEDLLACNSIEELDKKYTPILFAIAKNNIELVDKLIALGANKNKIVQIRNAMGKNEMHSPLELAIEHKGLVGKLIERGFNLDSTSVRMISELIPLGFPMTDAELLQLLKNVIDPRVLQEALPLLLIKEPVLTQVNEFLLKNVDLPLHYAVQTENVQLLEYLVNGAGLKTDQTDKKGNNALAAYCLGGGTPKKEIVNLMIKLGFNLHSKNEAGISAAQMLLKLSIEGAKTWYQINTIKHYFNGFESEVNSELMKSLTLELEGQPEIIQYLIKNGAQVDESLMKHLENQINQHNLASERLPFSMASRKTQNKKLKALTELCSSQLKEQPLAKNRAAYEALETDAAGNLTDEAALKANELLWEVINMPLMTGPELFAILTERTVEDAQHHTMSWEGGITKKAKAIEERFGAPIAVFFELKGNVAKYLRDKKVDEIVAMQRENYMDDAQREDLDAFEAAFGKLPNEYKNGSYVVIHALPNEDWSKAIPPTVVSQEELSYRCGFGSKGWFGGYNKSDLQKNVEAFLALDENGAHTGFIWINTLSNVSSVFLNYEKEAIKMVDPLNPAGSPKTFPTTQFYCQYCELAYFVNNMPNGNQKDRWIAFLQAQITNPEYRIPYNAHRLRGAAGEDVPGYNADKWKKDGKDLIAMKSCLRAKFTQNPLFLAELVTTAKDSRPLVQMDSDGYWGSGDDGKGLNHLGKCLMAVRDDIIAGRKTLQFKL